MLKGSYTVGVAGGSGVGKTYFLKQLANRFPSEDLCILSQDNYYKEQHQQVADAKGIINYDLPEGVNHDLFIQHIALLKNKKSVTLKEYTFNNPLVSPRLLTFTPAPLLVVEGLFVQLIEKVAKEIDLMIFLDAPDKLRLERRLHRDQEERGYGTDDVLYRYEHHTRPVFTSLLEPLRHKADLIISTVNSPKNALDVLEVFLKSKILY